MKLAHLFIPHHIEKKRAKLLQPVSLVGYVVFLLSVIIVNSILVFDLPRVLGYATNVKVADLLVDTNILRQQHNLKTLNLNPQLSKAAEAKALDMFANNYWAHTSPSGKEPWDFILASGYDYIYAGENLAVDFSDSKAVVRAWDNSPSHRDNLLSDRYTEIGFAVVNGELDGRKTTLVVQLFGYPRGGDFAALPVPESAVDELVVPEVAENTVGIETLPAGPQQTSPIPQVQAENIIVTNGSVLNASSVMNVSRYMAIIF